MLGALLLYTIRTTGLYISINNLLNVCIIFKSYNIAKSRDCDGPVENIICTNFWRLTSTLQMQYGKKSIDNPIIKPFFAWSDWIFAQINRVFTPFPCKNTHFHKIQSTIQLTILNPPGQNRITHAHQKLFISCT